MNSLAVTINLNKNAPFSHWLNITAEIVLGPKILKVPSPQTHVPLRWKKVTWPLSDETTVVPYTVVKRLSRCCSSAWRSHVTYLTFGSNCGPQLWRSCDICLAECGVYSSKHPAFCRSPAVTYFTLVADVTGYRSFAAYMERLALM